MENDANSADPAAGDSVERPAAGRRILRLTDLEHHYVFVRARLRLAQVSWDQGMLRIGATTVHDLYASLIATALYEVGASSLFRGERCTLLFHWFLIEAGIYDTSACVFIVSSL